MKSQNMRGLNQKAQKKNQEKEHFIQNRGEIQFSTFHLSFCLFLSSTAEGGMHKPYKTIHIYIFKFKINES